MNLVFCADGTGSTFDKRRSNVSRIIECLALDKTQVAFYDQGIGTNADRLKAFRAYQATLPASVREDGPLQELPGPPTGWTARLLGLAGGYGLKANVRQMCAALSRNYQGPGDRLFLFGFSRGAFTVRALAGLLYRCGLPGPNIADFHTWFEQAWHLYKPIHEDQLACAAFRCQHGRQVDCRIHFLGLWDTVKSYGGIWPTMLPHLRHNPLVRTVRQALALDEQRSWFNATTWGQLDSDRCGARLRLKPDDLPDYASQDIQEVWFRGCHSDIGGAENGTAGVTLRWMLREAKAAGLRLNRHGQDLAGRDARELVQVHEPSRLWWLSEIPRWEIDNSGTYPRRKFVWGRTGQRHPELLLRAGKVTLH